MSKIFKKIITFSLFLLIFTSISGVSLAKEFTISDGITVNVEDVCLKLSGLTSKKCTQTLVLNACEEDEVVCHYGKDQLADDGEKYTTTEKTNYKNQEKTDYCLLPNKHCYNETLWGEDGLVDYQKDQKDQAWQAIEDGDLGSAFCHSLAADTEGFFHCEEGAEGWAPEGGGPETTFTQFEGGFEPPAPDDYTDALTQSESVRAFILKITDFVLGFLGLLAVLAVIYGGFLYIFTAGDEGNVEKGKKIIINAIIGIIIVLMSFALVKTVICFAPVGGDDQASFCHTGAGVSVSNLALNLTEEVGTSSKTTFENAQIQLQRVVDGVLDSSTDYLNLQSSTDYLPNIEYALQGGLDDGANVLTTLKLNIDHYPNSLELINDMLSYLNTQSALTAVEKSKLQNLIDEYLTVSIANAQSGGLGGYSNSKYTHETQEDSKSSNENTTTNTPNINLDGITTTVNTNSPLQDGTGLTDFESAYEFMEYYSQLLKDAADIDYEENINKYIDITTNLEDLFTNLTDSKKEITDIKTVLQSLLNQKANKDILTTLIDEINEAADMIEELQFVDVKLNASQTRCKAPCTILFDSLGSVDPSGRTITDTQHNWDLNGNGTSGESLRICSEESKSIVSCLYDTPGTYIVTLKLDSAEPGLYPSGISTTRIEIERPLSQIILNVGTVDGVPFQVMDQTATPPEMNNNVKFTLEQAKNGIKFDAFGSKGSSGGPITDFTWKSGSESIAGSSTSHEFTFEREGDHRVTLDVTENGVTESAIVFVHIGSPASNFSIENATDEMFKMGETVNFDASYSKSDNGSIKSYSWQILKNNLLVEEEITTSEEWSYIPPMPGTYTVMLQVIDSIGKSDLNKKKFSVESQAPQACFTYDFNNDSQPNIVEIRNCSTDPDINDTLLYFWEVENGTFINGTDERSKDPIIKFSRTGKQNITLKVNDQYFDETIRKSDVITNEININSILDINLRTDNSAYQLDKETGEVEVAFYVESDNAVNFEIDYGDNESQNIDAVGIAQFKHIYNEAGVYNISATVFDSQDEDNTQSKKIYIGSSDAPLSVIELSAGDTLIDSSNGIIEIPRKTSIKFDGSDSLNKDGTGRRLKYMINYGDGTIGSTKVTNHIYDDIGNYEAVFTVTDELTGAYSSTPLTIKVVDVEPIIHNLSSHVVSDSLITPVDISVAADAEDPDGRVVQYTWYLFDAENTSNILETQISTGENSLFSFHGLGTTGDAHRVGVCVMIKDDGGNEIDSCKNGPYTYINTVTGENEPPKAVFSVQPSSIIKVGDSITFYDESTDDNGIESVYYDVDGDGFQNDTASSESSLAYIYDRIGTYPVRIKVIDANGASSVSSPVSIIVESSVDPPIAKFKYYVDNLTVDFVDQSEISQGTTLESRTWDLDIYTDSDGDGIPYNDIDQTGGDIRHTYDSVDSYTAKLTVTDSQGNQDDVEVQFNTISEPLKAKISSYPEPSPVDNAIHLHGSEGTVKLNLNASEGQIEKYVIDQDTDYNSDGSGGSSDDEDQKFTEPREAVVIYRSDWQPIEIKLTIYDNEGNSDSAKMKVVFDE